MRKEAKIFDFARLCRSFNMCANCPLHEENCMVLMRSFPEKANDIIVNWCEEHPLETRQEKFLKTFPKAEIRNGVLDLKPCKLNINITCEETKDCLECKKEYWFAEVGE